MTLLKKKELVSCKNNILLEQAILIYLNKGAKTIDKGANFYSRGTEKMNLLTITH